MIPILVDPGWNDPPMLDYSASNPPPKSRITYKRVAFPMNSTSTQSQLIPPSNTSLASSPPTNIGGQDLSPISNDSIENLDEVVSESAIEVSNFIINEQDKQLFFYFWKENKLSGTCRESIELLSKYLKEKDTKHVNEIKAKLLAEYKGLCDIWINSIEI